MSLILVSVYCTLNEAEMENHNGLFIRSPIVIQLNPYQFTTDDCLFQWFHRQDCDLLTMNQEDYKRLYGTSEEYEQPVMRYQNKLTNVAIDSLLPEWQAILRKDID